MIPNIDNKRKEDKRNQEVKGKDEERISLRKKEKGEDSRMMSTAALHVSAALGSHSRHGKSRSGSCSCLTPYYNAYNSLSDCLVLYWVHTRRGGRWTIRTFKTEMIRREKERDDENQERLEGITTVKGCAHAVDQGCRPRQWSTRLRRQWSDYFHQRGPRLPRLHSLSHPQQCLAARCRTPALGSRYGNLVQLHWGSRAKEIEGTGQVKKERGSA